MNVSLKNFILKHLVIALLFIIAIWAGLFYAFILDELYDNTDDGLKNLKIQIIREAFLDEKILETKEFDFQQFRITPINETQYKKGDFFRNELFFMEYDGELEPYRVLETYFTDSNKNSYKLEIRTSTVEEDDFGEDLFLALIALYLFLVISTIIINHLVLKKAWKPFYGTLNNLGKYEFGTTNKIDFPASRIKEFSRLNNEINKMIKRNEESFLQQKYFIENAAHELQTPLTIAINKLELLLEDESISEENLLEINLTREGLLRLVRLNKSLLTISRIENNQFGERLEMSFNSVLENILEGFSEMVHYKNIELSLSDKGVFKANMNPDLAYILLSNLLLNAIKYCNEDGEIGVEITEDKVVVKNTSVANSPLDNDLIFNRFYKQSKDNTSTGLGLSIVKSIIGQHSDLFVEYNFENNFHTFSLKHRDS
ncbi:MAG: HAMP domain-containing sensor histidine kinase [Pedobacter sp.]|uniref:sensor histidine kinase n=1 Tax=Pedobacter sp. TaxID=1411316 RepID=UPI0035634699